MTVIAIPRCYERMIRHLESQFHGDDAIREMKAIARAAYYSTRITYEPSKHDKIRLVESQVVMLKSIDQLYRATLDAGYDVEFAYLGEESEIPQHDTPPPCPRCLAPFDPVTHPWEAYPQGTIEKSIWYCKDCIGLLTFESLEPPREETVREYIDRVEDEEEKRQRALFGSNYKPEGYNRADQENKPKAWRGTE